MSTKNVLKIINEEISNFDFLSNDQHEKDQEIVEVLREEQFQKKFIIDSITRMRDSIKIKSSESSVSNDPEVRHDNFHNDLNIESNYIITYNYNQKPIELELTFEGNNIGYTTDYDYDSGSEYLDSWYRSINWDQISVHLYTTDGEEVKFNALEKAPDSIYELFIRSYIESDIEQQTDIGEIKEKKPEIQSF